eukprot:scaffold1246_cov134-Cylindrotheca_fusiformis.AAC.3
MPRRKIFEIFGWPSYLGVSYNMSKTRLEKSNILMVLVEKGGGFSPVFNGAKSSVSADYLVKGQAT